MGDTWHRFKPGSHGWHKVSVWLNRERVLSCSAVSFDNRGHLTMTLDRNELDGLGPLREAGVDCELHGSMYVSGFVHAYEARDAGDGKRKGEGPSLVNLEVTIGLKPKIDSETKALP